MEGFVRQSVVLCLAAVVFPQAPFSGQVQTPTRAPLAGTRLQFTGPDGAKLQVFADTHGRFVVQGAEAGEYSVTVEREGYFPIRSHNIRIEAGGEATFTLEPVREVVESVDVSSSPMTVDMDTSASRQSVTGAEIVNIPYPNTNDFRSALRIVPGVVRDRRGGLHVNGAGEDQVMYTLNGFNLTDPLTGRFESRLSVESVQSVEISSGNLSAEYGKGSAGTLAIRTISGDDKPRYTATNFVPGIEHRKGLIVGDWTPRVSVSGPLRRGRAWISDSVDAQYVNTVIRDLPKGEDRTASWRVSNLLHTQVNLSPSNILYAGFLMNRWAAARTGISALDPVETAVDRRSRQWFFHVKDQIYLSRQAIVEFGYAGNRTFGREIPQGDGFMMFTAQGKRGNYYIDGTRKAGRDQVLVNGFLPAFQRGGEHRVKAGVDLNHVAYWQNVRRTGFENFTESGYRVRRTWFDGSGLLDRSNYEAAMFAHDSWRARPGLLLEMGVRGDWDRLLNRWDSSPRLGMAWSPPGMDNTKLFAGFGRIYDATNLRLFTRHLDQYSLTTYFDPAGRVLRGPAWTWFQISSSTLARPRYYNWSAGVEHQWPGRVSLKAEMMRRRGLRGFAYRNMLETQYPDIDSVYELTNQRTDSYDSASFQIRHSLRRQYEWMASYTWSRALSNTVVDISVEDPISVQDNRGRMPWDSPHRFLTWGYLPTPFKNWALAYLLDARSGFPFSVQADDGRIVGGVNSLRFPAFLELNLHLERRFVFRGHRWALRLGANNLTNRVNPDTVNNMVSSSRYLVFYGGNGRSSNFRIRWLGKAR